ncbi:MAG: carboxypeptidase-like regulatory domain-containing protein, partial [Bryobacteraceae bacterium]
MSKFVLFAAVALLAGAVVSSAQMRGTPDTNPYDGSAATFGTSRPPMRKKQKPPTSRTVKGIVSDDSGKPMSGAMVTLTNKKTKDHQEFFTKKDGHYRFEDLSFTIDYQVQAAYHGRDSKTKPISQYDHTPSVVRMLDIPSAAAATSKKKTATTTA